MSDMGEWSNILSDNITTSRALTRVLRERRHSRCSAVWLCCVITSLVCSLLLPGCEGQGRLVDPPSRASMWRYNFRNPVDFNDDRVDCGGFVRQWRKNQGRCGVCGDPWDLPEPRPHETRGKYGRGIIVRNYTQAQAVVVEVEMTAASSGYFEYQLCPRDSAWTQETKDCFTHVLKDDFGRSQIPVNVTQKFARLRHVLRLPQEVLCLACILQWKFVRGGRAGRAEYRACADVSITSPSTAQEDNTTTSTTTTTTDFTTATTDADAGTTIMAEEITISLPTTPTSLPRKFDTPSSRVPEINLGYPHATAKPRLKSEHSQIDAPPTQTRMNDVMQNDSGTTEGDGNTAANKRPLALYYGITLSLVTLRYTIFI